MLKDCRIKFTDEIFKIEQYGEVTCDKETLENEGSPVKRKVFLMYHMGVGGTVDWIRCIFS